MTQHPDTKTNHQLRRGRLPLALQVAILLRKRLEEGEWIVGQQLPTLEVLMDEYGVSRATMRAAMDDLEKEGLIERGRGRGTFVTGDAAHDQWLILPTDWQGLVDHIHNLHTRVETLETGAGVPALPAGGGTLAPEYWYSRRVNWTDQAPYSLTAIHLDKRLYRKCPSKFAQGAVLPILASRFPEQIGKTIQVLTVSSANIESAHHLGLDIGAPVAVVRRTILDPEGCVIYMADVIYSALHLRIETVIQPPQAASAPGAPGSKP